MRHPTVLHMIEDAAPLSVVARVWGGKTVVCIGGGLSLTREQVDMVEASGVPTIAVNDAYLLAPWADVCYFCDFEWWGWHTKGVARPSLGLDAAAVAARFAAFAGQKCSISNSGHGIKDPAVHILRNDGDFGLSLQRTHLYTGRNSGFQALNLAVLAGAAKIILIGYDGKRVDGQPSHWFGEHPKPPNSKAYEIYRESFRASSNMLDRVGVKIFNASPGSAIEAFAKMELREALCT